MKRVVFFVSLCVLTVLLSNCGRKSEVLGTFKEIGRFTLKTSNQFASIKEFNGNFIAIDWAKPELFIFDKTGEVISVYNKVGKGPGELGQFGVDIIGTIGTTIFLSDRFGNKIMMYTYDEVKKTITFSDEFPINEGRVNAAAIGEDGLIYCNVGAKDYKYYAFDSKGVVVKKLVKSNPDEKKPAMAEAMIDNMRYEIKNKNGLFSVGYMTYTLDFYNADKNGDYVPLYHGLPKYVFKKDNYTLDTTANSISMTGEPGINGIFELADYFIFMVISDEKDENVFIQAYNGNGEYVGKYSFDTPAKKTTIMIVGSNKSDVLYIVQNSDDTKEKADTAFHEIIIAKLHDSKNRTH